VVVQHVFCLIWLWLHPKGLLFGNKVVIVCVHGLTCFFIGCPITIIKGGVKEINKGVT
jgi:hypothetical protein